jgi:YYY domain-containing protein
VSQALLALRWYFALQLFGLAAVPLTLRLFRHLPGRGYAFARPLGLLAGGWVFWLLLTFGWLPNVAGSVLVTLALLAALGAALWLRSSGGSASLSWRHVLAVEVLLAAALAGWCLVRAYMPRIETAGGEKWMEIAFLNAVLRAPRFPPHDPWLSGFAISYYYFGYVMMAMLVRLAAVPATIGFNLGIATLFALTCTGAYGLVYALLARRGERPALWGGLLGPLLVALTANLEGLLEVFHARGLFSAAFWRWLDIRSINGPPPPLAEGSLIPTRFIWWWQASRVLHDTAPWHTLANPADWEVIDEFPAFSFLLGDMHPHVLALPFVLVALALALALVLRPRSETWSLKRTNLDLPLLPWEFFTYALWLGGLGFLNTWDFPIYLFVVVGAFAVVSLVRSSRLRIRSLLPLAAVLAVGGFLLYLPFWLGLRSQAAGIVPNLFNGTRLPQFLVMFGPLLLPIAALVAFEARKRRVRAWRVAAWTGGGILALLAFLVLAGLASPDVRQYLAAWRGGGPVAIPGLELTPDTPGLVLRRLAQRILSPWTPLMLSALLSAAILILFRSRRPASDVAAAAEPGVSALEDEACELESAYALLLVVTGALLTLAVEFVYLRDNFGTRMNTVFKFYFQAWVLWGIAGAYGLARLLRRDSALAQGRRGRSPWQMALAPVALLLVMAGLVYPALAIPARAREHGGPPTLDGAGYLYEYQAPDLAAIAWLNEHVRGAPVILEAPGDGYRAYTYEGRVSAFTGLPTLLGWGGHQHQWRGDYDEPGRREPDIEALYAGVDPVETLMLLDRYDVEYVYVGPLERSRYPAPGLQKFAGLLEVVYDFDGVTVYRYPRPD